MIDFSSVARRRYAIYYPGGGGHFWENYYQASPVNPKQTPKRPFGKETHLFQTPTFSTPLIPGTQPLLHLFPLENSINLHSNPFYENYFISFPIQGEIIKLLLSRGADRTLKNKGKYIIQAFSIIINKYSSSISSSTYHSGNLLPLSYSQCPSVSVSSS